MLPFEFNPKNGENVIIINLQLYNESGISCGVLDLADHPQNDEFEDVVAASISTMQEFLEKGESPSAIFRQRLEERANTANEGLKNNGLKSALSKAMRQDCEKAVALIQKFLGSTDSGRYPILHSLSENLVKKMLASEAKAMQIEAPQRSPQFNAEMNELIAGYQEKNLKLRSLMGSSKRQDDAERLFPKSAKRVIEQGFFNKPTAKLYFAFHHQAIDEQTTQDFFKHLFEKSPQLQKLELTLISCNSVEQAERFSKLLKTVASDVGKNLEITVRGYAGTLIPASMLADPKVSINRTTPEGFVISAHHCPKSTKESYEALPLSYGNEAKFSTRMRYEVPSLNNLRPPSEATAQFSTFSEPLREEKLVLFSKESCAKTSPLAFRPQSADQLPTPPAIGFCQPR